MRIEGIVSSGLGRAHIFMSQHHYQEQFKTIIGRSAWPGTLNVKVEGESLIEYRKLRVSAGLDEGTESGAIAHRIKGFDRDGVSFGGATAKIVLPVEPSFQGIQGAANIRECLSEQKQGRCLVAFS